jgi:N-acylneuraminate cytidylyltransferase
MAALKTLALIPARGGSKGLPNKNILPLAGHPLIAYSIAAGKCTPRIDRVVVTTDSEEIAQISKAYGADVPFLRPPELAGDYTTDLETFQHALQWLEENEGYVPDLVLQLRPTSPIRFIQEIENCIDLLERHADAQSVRTVTPSPITPYKMWFMDGPESPLRPLLTVDGMDEPFNMPRQKLPPTFWQTGTYDLIRRSVMMEQHSMTGKTILPICIENALAIDIDDIQSFRKAEELLSKVSCIRP